VSKENPAAARKCSAKALCRRVFQQGRGGEGLEKEKG
jgi:hypothetical protein